MNSDPRVTAKITRTTDGDLHREYQVGGRTYSTIEAVERVVNPR